ncbi:hypothetical protein RFF05_09730 [Bengtsoniella intestinalis]|uniref:hypothetical protein n=1 Tax=Bengtsoniella intestinalis TaxID=3073143 RepID=UPI00391FAE73
MNQDWFEFINARMETEREQYGKTEEYRHRRVIEIQQEEMLETNLTKDEKHMVDEVMFARCLSLERDGERLYQQGMRDCVGVLKELGVIG